MYTSSSPSSSSPSPSKSFRRMTSSFETSYSFYENFYYDTTLKSCIHSKLTLEYCVTVANSLYLVFEHFYGFKQAWVWAKAWEFIWFEQARAQTFYSLSKLKLKLKLFYSFKQAQAQARGFCNVSSKLELELELFVKFRVALYPWMFVALIII